MSETSTTPPSTRQHRVQSDPAPWAALPELLQRIAAGEESALAELYDLTVPKLFGLAVLIVRNAQDAEDVVCDTFEQVWRGARQYDPQRGSALGWLLGICRSRAIDRHRRNSCRRAEAGPGLAPLCDVRSEPGPDDLLRALEPSSAMFHALAKLSPIERRLIALAFLQDLTHGELASKTELAVETVKSHIRRALATMRSELGDQGGGARAE
jgi:RNA polymerase sigma factor (sigma-70 family)